MWLQVPNKSEQTLWEGSLETDAADLERVQRSLEERLPGGVASGFLRDLPIVSIGRPEAWPLSTVYPPAQMPLTLRAKLEGANFYFVRLSCSFRPKAGGPQVEWARFQVSLLPDHTGRLPVCFDLYPLRVTNEVKRNTKVTLDPTVKFHEVEASVGGLEFGFEYTEIEPIISATGAGESVPSWDYQAAKGVHLQGSKWMHLLIKAPREMVSGFATLELTADVTSGGFRLPMFAKPKVATADPLRVQLWEA